MGEISKLDILLAGNRNILRRVSHLERSGGSSYGAGSVPIGGANTPPPQPPATDTPTTGNTTGRANLLHNASFEVYDRNTTLPKNWTVSAGAPTIVSTAEGEGLTVVSLPTGAGISQAVLGGLSINKSSGVFSIYVRAIGGDATVDLTLTHTGGMQAGSIWRVNHATMPPYQSNVVAGTAWQRFYISGIFTGGAPIVVGISCVSGTIQVDAAKYEQQLDTQEMLAPTEYQSSDWGVAETIRNFSANNITAGTLIVGGSISDNPKIEVRDMLDVPLVTIGKPNGGYNGIEVLGANGIKVNGGSIIAGTPGGARVEMNGNGFVGIGTDGTERVRISAITGGLELTGTGGILVTGGGGIKVEGAGTILAGTAGAARVEMAATGLLGYDPLNVKTFDLSAATGHLFINGDFVTATGKLTLTSLEVTGEIITGQDFRVGTNVLFVDQSQSNIGINRTPDPQFDLDVMGNIRSGGYIVGKHAIQLDGATLIAHYDGAEPYNSDYTGEATGHRGHILEATWVVFREGKYGKAVEISEATTNLITNPSFEENLSGWTIV